MIKYTIILMNMLALHVYPLFFAADVNIKIDAPSQVKQGEEFTVSITINKGSIAGVGYMMQTLPAGFGNATVVGAKKGSEFKYVPAGNVVKFIWNSLPADHEFTVSYKVKVNTDAPTGNVTLAGKFSYVRNNQKQTFIVPDVSITVGGATPVTTTTTQPATTATTTTATATVTKPPEVEIKIKENNIFRDFKDQNNQSLQPGYYVIVGSFLNLENAKNLVQRLLNKGFKAANRIYFEPTKFNYVFIIRVNTKEEALKQIINAKVAGYEDVWIQRLIE